MTKTLTIAKRLKNGWTEPQENKSQDWCDDCTQILWVAPDGKTLYCDNLSSKHKEKKQ